MVGVLVVCLRAGRLYSGLVKGLVANGVENFGLQKAYGLPDAVAWQQALGIPEVHNSLADGQELCDALGGDEYFTVCGRRG